MGISYELLVKCWVILRPQVVCQSIIDFLYFDFELLTMNNGLLTMDHGLSTMDYRLWTMDYGLWTMDHGLWTMDYKSKINDQHAW